MNSCCIYRHIKPNGEVFYIGIGKTIKRAYVKSKRSEFWKNIVAAYGYEVQILKQDLSWEEACELEKMLISHYGRRDLKLGPLVNLTDGGDGGFGVIQSKETRDKRRVSMIGKNSRDKHSLSKPVISFKDGTIVDCLKDLSDILNIGYSKLKHVMAGRVKNNTDYEYVVDKNHPVIKKILDYEKNIKKDLVD